MQRTATAVWRGTGLEGSGTLDSMSGTLKGTPYSTKMRFQDESGRSGTNPEELIAAAHAGCFNMQLAFMLNAAGFTADELSTRATVKMAQNIGSTGWSITHSTLELTAKIPGASDADLQRIANEAKAACPVSRVLNAEIELKASLQS